MSNEVKINTTLYLTLDMVKEIERQASIYTNGIKARHLKQCVEIGLEHFQKMEIETEAMKNCDILSTGSQSLS